MIIQNSYFDEKELSLFLYGTEACVLNAVAGTSGGYQQGM